MCPYINIRIVFLLQRKSKAMKFFSFLLLLLLTVGLNAQSSLNMNLVYQWSDATLVPSTFHDNTYNEVWGYASNGREYAIIGSTDGTHIFDITDINNVDTAYFIPGRVQGGQIVHRDYDTYRDHLYIVSDEGQSSLQIADLSFLPDSAPVVYDDDLLITTSHNIFIDTAAGNLYSCGGVTDLGVNYLSVYSLVADPTDPQFVINCSLGVPSWNSTVAYVHDIYVKNDTAYCNAGTDGLFVVDFSNMGNVQIIGALTNYLQQGYNHSGWLHESGDYYAFADEDHGTDVKIIDVTNINNLAFIDTIGANVDQSLSIPHNLIFKDDMLFISYYFDGLYVFNTSNLNNISLAGYYDTSTRLHQMFKYEGNWGVYPFLPSGKILASDMQEGLFIFDTSFPPSGVDEITTGGSFSFIAFPNPATNSITVTTTVFNGVVNYTIIDVNGKLVKNGELVKSQTKITLDNVASGVYAFSIVQTNGEVVTKKFIKQ